ncbi:MAG: prepilin peptidase [Candidatus Kaiserbacteria bacterium]|nr:MAG: prepilin peptidase [Candidatus Kaiserbacteria bacterium]
MTAVFFALFGLIVGSFLNVLILRWGKEGIGGRSRCPVCKRELAWFDLIPIFSWIFLRGRCRTCGARISIQYPLVEGATALTFALIGASPVPLTLQLFALPIAALLIAIAVYDLYHTIIPDVWAYVAAVLSLAAALTAPAASDNALEIVLSGPIAAAPLFLLWLVSRGRWMGLGDGKLALTLGWLLGFPAGLIAVFFAFVLGALVSVPLLLLSHAPASGFTPTADSENRRPRFTMKSEIPFGPFLIASCFILWFMQMYGVPLPLTLF